MGNLFNALLVKSEALILYGLVKLKPSTGLELRQVKKILKKKESLKYWKYHVCEVVADVPLFESKKIFSIKIEQVRDG